MKYIVAISLVAVLTTSAMGTLSLSFSYDFNSYSDENPIPQAGLYINASSLMTVASGVVLVTGNTGPNMLYGNNQIGDFCLAPDGIYEISIDVNKALDGDGVRQNILDMSMLFDNGQRAGVRVYTTDVIGWINGVTKNNSKPSLTTVGTFSYMKTTVNLLAGTYSCVGTALSMRPLLIPAPSR